MKEQNIRQVIEGLWYKYLPHNDHELSDDFFAAGGDSLGATRLLSDLQRIYDRELTVSLIGEGLTIDRLISALEGSMVEKADLGGARDAWERI